MIKELKFLGKFTKKKIGGSGLGRGGGGRGGGGLVGGGSQGGFERRIHKKNIFFWGGGGVRWGGRVGGVGGVGGLGWM